MAKGFADDLFAPNDFMMVTPQLVAALKGDAVAALVAIRIRFRQQMFGREDADGIVWWRASQKELSADTGLSDDQVQRAINRLVDAGLVEKSKERRGPSGQWDQTLSYRVVTENAAGQQDSAQPRDGDGADHSAPTLHHHSAPTRQDHSAPTRNLPMEDREEDPEDTPSPVDLFGQLIEDAKPSPSAPVRVHPEVFEDWWQHYPRKVGKGAARKVWDRVTGKQPQIVPQLLDAVKSFALHCKGVETRYIPHPATWLNQERWLDDEPASPQNRRTVADGNGDYWASGGQFMGGGK